MEYGTLGARFETYDNNARLCKLVWTDDPDTGDPEQALADVNYFIMGAKSRSYVIVDSDAIAPEILKATFESGARLQRNPNLGGWIILGAKPSIGKLARPHVPYQSVNVVSCETERDAIHLARNYLLRM